MQLGLCVLSAIVPLLTCQGRTLYAYYSAVRIRLPEKCASASLRATCCVIVVLHTDTTSKRTLLSSCSSHSRSLAAGAQQVWCQRSKSDSPRVIFGVPLERRAGASEHVATHESLVEKQEQGTGAQSYNDSET
jgi:hypothetical protein